MKRKIFALLLCMVFICTLSLPVYADSTTTSSDGYSALISDIPKTCPTCGSSLHASWFSTSGAEVELTISDNGTIKIPAGAGVVASIRLYCTNCKYEKTETCLLGLDWGSERPGEWKVEKAPTGIGRKDLPGYADDKGSALVDKDGWPTATYTMLLDGYDTSAGVDTVYQHNTSNNGSWFYQTTGSFSGSNGNVSVYGIYDSSSSNNNRVSASLSYYLIAPVTGYYTLNTTSFYASVSMRDRSGSYLYGSNYYFRCHSWFGKGIIYPADYFASIYPKSDLPSWHLSPCSGNKLYFSKGDIINFSIAVLTNPSVSSSFPYASISIESIAPTLTVQDLSPSQITNNNNITINNNTWNGNIYTDNSTNLTYIYPQYTTINEKNETVTNISNTPIIYNNETKKYYTYDTVTNNYYYITYEQPATPTPSPSPSPAPTETPSPSESPTPTPTPDPGTAPTSTPKPGGSISTPETGKPGGSSGSSWWDKLLDKIGNAVIDGLLGAVSAVLKLIFKLLSTILGWIIWAVSLVFTLFPFLPPGLSGLLVGGVVVCFVIGIIKFIRG